MCVCNDKYRNLFDNIKTRIGNQRLGDADAFGGHVRFRVHGGRGGESVRVIPHQRTDADAALPPESHHLVALLEYLAALEGEHECTFAGFDILGSSICRIPASVKWRIAAYSASATAS